MHQRFDRLISLYELLDTAVADDTPACRPGCSACCTVNVTLTRLEGKYLLEHLQTTGQTALLAKLPATQAGRRFQPPVTINQWAQICASPEDADNRLSDAENDPAWGPCPLLMADGRCPVYAARPLVCRSLWSDVDCRQTGEADLSPLQMALADLFAQALEHLDRDGFYGNLTDVLSHLVSHPVSHWANPSKEAPPPLIPNHPLTVLMVPPDQRAALTPFISSLRRLLTP